MTTGEGVPQRGFGNLLALLGGHSEDVAEAAWLSAAGALEAAAVLAREASHGRFRGHPSGELRRLRRGVALGLNLARIAAAIQQDENDHWHELERPAREAAAAANRVHRRAQTMPAELARLANQAARRAENGVVAGDPSC